MASVFEGVDTKGYSEPATETNPQEFEKVVRSRRSVRVFEQQKIPDDVLQSCIDLALLAPNSSNLQTWQFYVVRSEEKRTAINEACLSQPAATTAAAIVVCVVQIDSWREHAKEMLKILKSQPTPVPKSALDYYAKLVPLVYTQGPFGILGFFKKVGIALTGLFKPVPREPTSIADLRVWAHKSAALACENLMLAFRAYGYDSCPMEGLDSARVKKALGLGGKAEIVMAVGAGKRAPSGIYGPQIRFDRKKFVFEV